MIMTLVEMLEYNARESPHKQALVYKDTKYNYKELNSMVNRIANSMNAMGIGKGDRVVLVLPRTPEIIISFLASVKIGAIPAPMNFNLTDRKSVV